MVAEWLIDVKTCSCYAFAPANPEIGGSVDILALSLDSPVYVRRDLRTKHGRRQDVHALILMDGRMYAIGYEEESPLVPGGIGIRNLEKSMQMAGTNEIPEADIDEYFDIFERGVFDAKRGQSRIEAKATRVEIPNLEAVDESVRQLVYWSTLAVTPDAQPVSDTARAAAQRIGSKHLRDKTKIGAQRMLRSAADIHDILGRENGKGRLVLKDSSVRSSLMQRKGDVMSVNCAINPRLMVLARLEDELVRFFEGLGTMARQARGHLHTKRIHTREQEWSDAMRMLRMTPIEPFVRLSLQMQSALAAAVDAWLRSDHTSVAINLTVVEALSRLPRIRRNLSKVVFHVRQAQALGLHGTAFDWDEVEDELMGVRHAYHSELLQGTNIPHIAATPLSLEKALEALRARDLVTADKELLAACDLLDGPISSKKRRR